MINNYGHKNAKVSVCTLTYNQEKYIRKSLDGIVGQKTTFPFEIIIHDDCSTDGTRKILLEYKNKYPDKIKLLLSDENLYKQGIDMFTKCVNEAEGNYIAWCEGDDEWIDDHKLQIQFNYLESHPQCSLVYTNTNVYIEKENRIEQSALTSGFIKSPKSFKEHLKKAGHLAPLTWMFRKNCYVPTQKRYFDWSYSIALDLFAKGEVHFIDRTTALYRIFNESVSHSNTIRDLLKFGKGLIEIKDEYIKRYNYLLTNEDILQIRYYTHLKYLPSALALDDIVFLNQCANIFIQANDHIRPFIIRTRKYWGIKYLLRFLYLFRGRK